MLRSQSADAYVVAWSQIRVNGSRPGPNAEFPKDAHLSWFGHRIDIPGGAANTEQSIARAITRLSGREQFLDGLSREEPLVEKLLFLTDGDCVFRTLVVRTIELSRPFVVFLGGLPPERTRLWACEPGEFRYTPASQTAEAGSEAGTDHSQPIFAHAR